MAVSSAELGNTYIPPEALTPVTIHGRSNTLLEKLQSAIEERNRHDASALSLVHNEPNDEGRTRVQQENDRLRRSSRSDWKRTKNPLGVGETVLIPVGTPVGLGSDLDSYLTEKPLKGTLVSVFGGYGGMGYGQRSDQLAEPLFKVSVQPEGQESTETITLLVPNDLLTQAVPQGNGMAIA